MDEMSSQVNLILLKGLVIRCPLGEAAEDCPARELRAIPVDRRMIEVETLPCEEVESIVVRHKKCFARRKER
ncbi:MAG: hypothetical protein QGH94_08145 [Phycisphaerae bacterium]|jgi:hypothetical protein|nr:hypothetical protein [Phycisphaerae bacterium]